MLFRNFNLFALIILSILSTISARKKDKSEDNVFEKSDLFVEPETSENEFGNRTKYTVTQYVKSKKVSCGRESITEMSRSVRCKPRLTVVELLSGTRNKFIPNAILVKRCSGSCDGFQKCVATKSVNTTYFIKEIVKNKTYCSAVPIFEDKDCHCDCILKPKDCSAYQRYSSNTCSCKCNDDTEYRKCRSSSNKLLQWNERKCTCECVGSKTCNMGTTWDISKCRCIKQQ